MNTKFLSTTIVRFAALLMIYINLNLSTATNVDVDDLPEEPQPGSNEENYEEQPPSSVGDEDKMNTEAKLGSVTKAPKEVVKPTETECVAVEKPRLKKASSTKERMIRELFKRTTEAEEAKTTKVETGVDSMTVEIGDAPTKLEKLTTIILEGSYRNEGEFSKGDFVVVDKILYKIVWSDGNYLGLLSMDKNIPKIPEKKVFGSESERDLQTLQVGDYARFKKGKEESYLRVSEFDGQKYMIRRVKKSGKYELGDFMLLEGAKKELMENWTRKYHRGAESRFRLVNKSEVSNSYPNAGLAALAANIIPPLPTRRTNVRHNRNSIVRKRRQSTPQRSSYKSAWGEKLRKERKRLKRSRGYNYGNRRFHKINK